MIFFDLTTTVLAATGLLLLALYALRRRPQHHKRPVVRDALDTVADWPPDAARVMSFHERQAYDLLRQALPGMLVLAQVPLSRFLRVPTRHSYADWLGRVGSLSADLLICDAGSRVLAVVDIRVPQESDRSRRRHERLTRVLRAAGIRVVTWREGALPPLADVRVTMARELYGPLASSEPKRARSQPGIPLPDIAQVLAEGDRAAANDALQEPVPSGFYDEAETIPGPLSRR
jgi:hypothetical protein